MRERLPKRHDQLLGRLCRHELGHRALRRLQSALPHSDQQRAVAPGRRVRLHVPVGLRGLRRLVRRRPDQPPQLWRVRQRVPFDARQRKATPAKRRPAKWSAWTASSSVAALAYERTTIQPTAAPAESAAKRSEVCSASKCDITCSTGEACAGFCVDVTSDPANCGSCGNNCPGTAHASPSCTDSECRAGLRGRLIALLWPVPAHRSRYAKLLRRLPARSRDGHELPAARPSAKPASVACNATRLHGLRRQVRRSQTSREHCGSCTKGLRGRSGSCCRRANARPTAERSRPATARRVHLGSDHSSNCCASRHSRAGRRPIAMPRCNDGSCTFQCNGSLVPCDGACVDAKNDSQKLRTMRQGLLRRPQRVAAPAASTACAACKCNAGLTACGGKCVNTNNDKNNCGSCGNVCKWLCYSAAATDLCL